MATAPTDPAGQSPTKTLTPGAQARRFPRIAQRLKVLFRITNVSGSKPADMHEAYSRDFSAGGMFLELGELHFTEARSTAQDNYLLFKGVLELEFSLEGCAEPFKPKGKIVWIEKEKPGRPFRHGVALCFLDMSEEQIEAINAYVLANLPEQEQPLPQVGEGER